MKNKGQYTTTSPCASGETTYGFPSRVSPRVSLLLLVLFPCLTTVSSAAVSFAFVESTMVNDTVIRLGDIARIHGVGETLRRELGAVEIGQAAPPGFARFVGHIEALRYGVASRYPALELSMPSAGRTRVATDSKTIRLSDYRTRIMDYLTEVIEWKPEDYQVEIENLDKTWRGYNRPATIALEGVEESRPRGHTRMTLIFSQGGRVQRVAVRCFVRVSTPVLVTAETVRRGESLGAVNVERRRTDITTFRYDPLTELSSLEDSRAVRTLAPGTILHERCIEKPPLVRRDEMVYVTTRKGNIRVSVQARARESGGLGDHIWVQNLASRTLLRVKICGKGRVKVETGEAI